MGTLVCFHAHPDDESISTGGTLARASAEGHRVVVVIATNGEYGEVPEDLVDGETLVDRRRAAVTWPAAHLPFQQMLLPPSVARRLPPMEAPADSGAPVQR